MFCSVLGDRSGRQRPRSCPRWPGCTAGCMRHTCATLLPVRHGLQLSLIVIVPIVTLVHGQPGRRAVARLLDRDGQVFLQQFVVVQCRHADTFVIMLSAGLVEGACFHMCILCALMLSAQKRWRMLTYMIMRCMRVAS